MTDQFVDTNKMVPITPPPELVSDWRLAPEYTDGLGKLTMVTITVDRLQYIATQAARWGADQELEACCEWLDWQKLAKHENLIAYLRAARRPKPPSLKERALATLQKLSTSDYPCNYQGDDDWDAIRRALEQLDD